ncbi:glycosyltransferase family 39 protein [Gemmatimonadota bacterium]
MQKSLSNGRSRNVLVLILLVAAIVRFYGIDWGIPGENQPRSYHPDEKMAPLVLSRMRPAEGRFNPYYFINPSLFYYQYGLALAPVSKLAGITPPWQVKDYVAFTEHDPREQGIWFLTGRFVSALMGIIAVWAVFWVGTLLAGRTMGLVSAAIFAVTPAHLIQSHYMVVDGPAVMWMVLSLGFFLCGLQQRRSVFFALSGLLLGFGLATKYTVVMVVLPQLVLAFQTALDSAGKKKKKKIRASGFSGIVEAVRLFVQWILKHRNWALFWAVLAAAGFIIGCPYMLLDWKTFMGSGGIGGLRSYNTFGFSLFTVFRVSFLYGLGLPLALFVLASLLLVVSRPAAKMFSVGIFLLANILLLILNASPYMRHFVPLTPFLALCGGYLALEVYQKLLPRLSGTARKVILAASMVIIGYTIVYDMSLLQAMGRQDPRDAAMEWLQENAEKYQVISVVRPEWGEDFYSVPVDKITFSHVVTGFEYRLVEAYKPDYIVITEYELNDYLQPGEELDFKNKLISSSDYKPVAVFRRKSSFFGLPVWYNPPSTDWLYFYPEVTIYGRTIQADSSRALYIEGKKFHEEKNYGRAEDAFAKSGKLDQDNPLHLFWLAFNRIMVFRQLVSEGQIDPALDMLEKSAEILERALAVYPRSWMRVEILGVLSNFKTQEGIGLMKAGRVEKAQECLLYAKDTKKQQKVVADSLAHVTLSAWDKKYNEVLMFLADSYLSEKKYQEAGPVLVELLKRDSRHKRALINLGNVYLNYQNRHAQALKLFKRALALYPELAERGNITTIVNNLERDLNNSSRP